MASPFPGMDPYLEQHWGDVHHRLITYASDRLQRELPRDLRARVEERVFVETPRDRERSLVPDVRVFEQRRRQPAEPALANGVTTAEPLVLVVDEPAVEGFIEIREVGSGKRLVTVIEVLSLANKTPGDGRDKYLQKQRELRDGRVSLVEIDLLRGGDRLLPIPWERIPPAYRTPYQVCVRRAWKPIEVELYRVPLEERLPVIAVPLRETDRDVPLDLQALIEQCYANGGYEDDLDYQAEPSPPLSPAESRWADALLRRQGRRKGGTRRGRRKTR